jgi:hypothetical protein
MSTYTPIATQTLSSAAASITFSSIPQGYTDLVVSIDAICASGGTDLINLQYNGDTSSGLYSSTRLVGNGSTTNSDRQTGANFIYAGLINSTVRNSDIYQIQNYSNTATFKTCVARASVADNQTRVTAGLWRNISAITSLTISHASSINFSIGSTFSIYGIQVGNPAATKAEGGNIITTDGTYWYHAFTSSGTFITNEALTANILVIAGGGGGGSPWNDGGGGGGAGGLVYLTSQSLTATTYLVAVGAGGAVNKQGANSQFGSLTAAVGGGFGGSYNTTVNGGNGGSGGGTGASNSATPGSPTSGQGNAGGYGYGGASAGGGGGGAGAAGSNATQTFNSSGGNGGAGVNTYSSWASATSTGVSGYYAGGGGGGAYTGYAGEIVTGTGGAGGGGAGGGNGASEDQPAITGTANTGGGGGGAGYKAGSLAGAAGGSGIVIIRYAV